MEASTTIRLKSESGEIFELSEEAANLSDLIRDATEGNEEEEPEPIEIARVSTPCLQKVVAFLKHYTEEKMKDIPTPLGGSSFNEVMDQEWYQKFVSDDNVDRDMVFELLTAANFMGIKPLLDLICLKVTFQLTGKSADEIREILRLPEMTPEEEAQAREDHPWIFEES